MAVGLLSGVLGLACLGAFGLGIVAIAIYLYNLYNTLVVKRENVHNAWAQIDTQLKRRADLIPNLVNTVKGYAKHEKETFENVTKARSALMSAKTVAEKAKANNFLTETLKSLFAVVENYPNLKANENFMQLQEELSDTENKISTARTSYNNIVYEYNIVLKQFPNNVIAPILGFKEEEYFEVEGEEREAPKVEF